MANKLKKSDIPIRDVEKKEIRPEKTKMGVKKNNNQSLKKDREEKIDLKKLARDERTWKIVGTLSLLISIFLLIAFISYFFTWKEDQDQVLNNESGFLWDNDQQNNKRISNLLGRLGAYLSHFFIYRGFGIASLLFCTFFFVSGINLLFNRKVFSIWRNLKYVTVGLLIVSVGFAFIFSNAAFPYGGRVGDMINTWLINFLGILGTAALLVVVGVSYLIWQFNPVFKMPGKKVFISDANNETDNWENVSDISKATDILSEKRNVLKGDGSIINLQDDKTVNGTEMIEKENDIPLIIQSPVEKEMVDDILHREEMGDDSLSGSSVKKSSKEQSTFIDNLELEIKIAEDEFDENGEKGYSDLPPYEPTLDLRDYKYPTIDLLETHGSEKIVQDPGELEANKNQIITTLKNYDITIQKISATVGPTVTLYEIVPAAGVRISRIKNLEDDIALSLAALGIRIIAPIPGKG
ncbi:MAG: DNA translocase FtsK 4TM domain-containing protein, partial [Bacteroidota bacterium]|nr:DNA translocase FtsK 4TM domain-containing protein [Bacteroidota bacterium]